MEADPKEKKEPKKVTPPGQKIVLWIDANIKSKGNQKGVSRLKDEVKAIVEEATTVDEGFQILKKYHLTLVFVITSGALSQEYMDKYERNLKDISVLTANIIFCGNAKYHITKVFAGDQFYNFGGVVTKFADVISFINDEKFNINYKDDEDNKNSQTDKLKWGFSFKKVSHLEELVIPAMLGKFVDEDDIDQNAYKNFLQLIENYKLSKLNFFAGPTMKMGFRPPFYLFSKFFLYLYSMETPFYPDLNKQLSNKDSKIYNPFIYSLYMGLKEKYLKSCYTKRLYRGAKIAEKELMSLIKDKEDIEKKLAKTKNKAKGLIGDLKVSLSKCTSNCFLSFTYDEKVAHQFLRKRKLEVTKGGQSLGDLRICKFIIEPLSDEEQKSGFFVSNVVLGDCSASENEAEVLVLPFSCFEVVSITNVSNEKTLAAKGNKFGPEDITTITLKYLCSYEKSVKDFIKWQKPSEVIEFLSKAAEEEGDFIQRDDEEELITGNKKEGKLQNFYQKKVIIWIDQFVNSDKYKNILEQYKEQLKDYTILKANTVGKGYQILRMYDNQFVYVIISAYLSEEFMKAYEGEAKKNGLLSANIILCENNVPDEIAKYKAQNFIGDSYINPGGFIYEDPFDFPKAFGKALEYIFKDENGYTKKVRTPTNDFPKCWGTSFKQTEIGANVFKEKLGKYDNNPGKLNEDLKAFGDYIYNRYDSLKDLGFPTKEKNINIPLYCYNTNFLKMYVCEGAKLNDPKHNNFFVNMNMELTNEKCDKYLAYIYVMYSAVKNGILENFKGTIYKGTQLKKKEINQLLKISADKNKIVWTKPFLTCTKSEKVAEIGIENYEEREEEEDEEEDDKKDDLEKVKFVFNPPKEGIFVSNMNTGKFKRFGNDEEIVVFPFTPFTISEIKKENDKDYTTLILDYYYDGKEKEMAETVQEGRFGTGTYEDDKDDEDDGDRF